MLTTLIRLSLMALTLFLSLSNTVFSAPAPDFKLAGQHKQIKLSDYRGKVIYLDFWASWCQPCRNSFAWMNKMQSLYGDKDFKVIAINLDESRKDANKFLQQIPANFEVAFDPRGNTAESYQVKAMPSSYIIDKHGNVIHANLGFHDKDEKRMEAKIRNLIHQSTIASR